MYYFPAASWPTSLKLISFFGLILLLGVSYQAWLAVPPAASAGEFTHRFGLTVAAILPILLFGSVLFIVRGYSITATHLYIHRLLWKTAIPLKGFSDIEFAPDKLKCSMRLFGNGGLFAFTGLYQNKTMGRFRLFATDFNCAVILYLASKTVVITPKQPQVLVDYMHRHFLKNHFQTAEHPSHNV
jgi:hypothetical protein